MRNACVMREKEYPSPPANVIVECYKVKEIVNVIARDMEKKETVWDIIKDYVNSIKPGMSLVTRRNVILQFYQREYFVNGKSRNWPRDNQKIVSEHTIDYYLTLLKGAKYFETAEYPGEYEVLRHIPANYTAKDLRREYEMTMDKNPIHLMRKMIKRS